MRKLIVTLLLSLSLVGCADSTAAITQTAAETVPTEAQTEQTSEELSIKSFDIIPITDSTCLDRAGYNSANQMLYIRFLDSQKEYVYYDVPESVYEGLINAESVGFYYNSSIKGSYECERFDEVMK